MSEIIASVFTMSGQWFVQGIDVTKQNEVDKMMIALDGTDSKCAQF